MKVLIVLNRLMPGNYFFNSLLLRAILLNPSAGDPATIHRLMYQSIRHELLRLLGAGIGNGPPPYQPTDSEICMDLYQWQKRLNISSRQL
jgi:hypothetical protein